MLRWLPRRVSVRTRSRCRGFKTCADIEKAEQEGEVVIYATSPEQVALKVLARFHDMFPKIAPNYLRLQAGALMAKVQSERQAQTYLVDAMQVSDMGMILDFSEEERLLALCLARDVSI